MPWTRIGRNRKKVIAQVFANVTKSKSYHFDDMYGESRGEHGPEAKVWLETEFHRFDFAKLYFDGKAADGTFKYVLYLHSNCNYDFNSSYCPPGFEVK